MKKMTLLGTVAVLAFLALATSAKAADITYDVDLTVGTGTVVGTITTNGTLGVLTESDIVGGSVEISGAGSSDAAGLPGSIFEFIGDDLSATSNSLLFNFSGTDDGGVAIGNSTTNYFWNIVDTGFPYGADPDTPGMDIYNAGAVTETSALTGDVVIATIPTPEPGTLSMMTLGMLGLCLLVGVKLHRGNRLTTTA
jgi:hypothetical protein